MIDYHNHTILCKHAEGHIGQYVEQAVRKGIKQIAFTDHNPMPDNFDTAHRMSYHEMDHYAKMIESVRQKFPEIKILFGIEMDHYPGNERENENFLNRYDFDLAIMSVHFMKHWPPGNWVFNYNFPNKSYEDVYRDYLNTILEGAKTGLYDVLGHVDIIRQPGHSMVKMISDEVDSFLSEVHKLNMTIEINSSGFRKQHQDSFPGLDWLDRIKANNINICVGSDSHAPEQVALNFDFVYQKLHQAGFNNIVQFEKRKPNFLKI